MIPRNQGSIARDLLQKGFGEMEIRGFRVEGYCRQIHDLRSYYSVSMELLDPAVRRQAFPLENRCSPACATRFLRSMAFLPK